MPRLLADLTPLKVSPDFRRLWWGLGVSNLGSQVTVVAVGLQVFEMTESTLSVGLLGIFALVPLLILGLYGGALGDRYDRRKISLLACCALWIVAALIAVQAWLNLDSIGLLYGLVAVQSAAFAINNPARAAIIPRLLPAELMPSANALQGAMFNTAMMGGPLVGSALVAGLGFDWAYTIGALMFSASLYATFRLPAIPPLVSEGDDGAPLAAEKPVGGFRSVLVGLRYLATRPNLRTSFVVDICAMVLAFPRVLWPAAGLMFLGGGATTTGILAAAFAVGGLLATVFSGPLKSVVYQGRAILWAIAGWAVSISLFGLVLVLVGRGERPTVMVGALVAACVALALAGGTDAVSAVFRQSMLQTAAPDHLRARVQGVFLVVVAGGPRLGELWLGAQADWFGEGWAAVSGGILCLVAIGLVAWRNPKFRAYNARHPEP